MLYKYNPLHNGGYAKMDGVARGAKKAAAAQYKACYNFTKEFLNADKQVCCQCRICQKPHRQRRNIFFKDSPMSLQSVFGSDRKYWSQCMKTVLGVAQAGSFPYQLAAMKRKIALPIPPINYTETAPTLKNLFSGDFKIYATPEQFFVTQFCDIFQKTRQEHTDETEAKAWMAGPKIKYWPQQLNLAVFCIMQACGMSQDIFDKGVSLPPQIRAFYQFHVYFTVRRILFQLGGIQSKSKSVLPGDPNFNQFHNPYDKAASERICREFRKDPLSDFRFTSGLNHGLGAIYMYMYDIDRVGKAEWAHFPEWHVFSEKNISYITPDSPADRQCDWFAPKTASGLTQAGLSRINQSMEAFVYCILGAQINVRSSILGAGSRAKEAQSEFLVLMEDAIRQPNLAQSVQRYQLAVDQAKVRLNLAVAPMAWLMPANMIINTASVVGYNNKLKQAVLGTKLGVNNEVNTDKKKAALKLMAGGPSKINPPNSNPSNPVHKAESLKQKTKPAAESAKEPAVDVADPRPQHEINKTAIIIGVVGVAAWMH